MKRSSEVLRCLFGLLFLFGVTDAFAQSVDGGIDKASDGQFTGLLLVTDNLDWYDMFQRPEPPSFEAKEHFAPGEKGSLAIIFSNAEPRDGVVRVLCDITAHDPSGSRQIADDQLCYEGPYSGPNILHPALLDLRFEIGDDEPSGQSGFSVTLKDDYSDRVVALDIAFTQGDEK